MTLRFAVIGHPIEHSRSPQLHEAGFREFNIDATFEKIDVAPENLQAFIKNESKNYKGIAVTVPHKEAVLEMVDKQSEAAIACGSINTLYFDENQTLCGTSTDGMGALRALQTETELKGKNVFILGAGGAARSIIHALTIAEAEVVIYNRSFSKAEELSKKFDITALESLQLAIPDEIDIVINATSVGMNELRSLLPTDFWMPHHIGFDIVYSPLYTQFLQDCENAGGTPITGDKMLVHQALEQFRIWNDKSLETEIMEAAFFDA